MQMILKISILYLMMILSSLHLLCMPASAVDFHVQPRLEAGAAFYALKIGAVHHSIPTLPDAATGENLTQEKIEYKDTLAFIGGGMTLFLNRLFLDLGAQFSFDGSDDTESSYSSYQEDDGEGSSRFISSEQVYSGTFHHQDQAISLGYAATEQISVFVGYKWAELELETTFEGPYSYLAIDSYLGHGTQFGHENLNFKYAGPFVGVTRGWQIESSSRYFGLLSMNLALALLKCKLDQEQDGTIRYTSVNGVEIEPIDESYTYENEVNGDTLGLTLSLGWHGVTLLEDLTYSVAVSGYRYQFDLDEPGYSNVSESAVVCKVGLSYTF
jgi:hypothetical protein